MNMCLMYGLNRYLIQVECEQRILLAGDDDDSVTTDNSWGKERHETKQRQVIRASDADDAHWLVDLHRSAVQRRLLINAQSIQITTRNITCFFDNCREA